MMNRFSSGCLIIFFSFFDNRKPGIATKLFPLSVHFWKFPNTSINFRVLISFGILLVPCVVTDSLSVLYFQMVGHLHSFHSPLQPSQLNWIYKEEEDLFVQA